MLRRLRLLPRFFFDVHSDGHVFSDDVGVECAGTEDACREATRALAEIARDALPRSGPSELSIEVRDATHRPLMRAILTFDLVPL